MILWKEVCNKLDLETHKDLDQKSPRTQQLMHVNIHRPESKVRSTSVTGRTELFNGFACRWSCCLLFKGTCNCELYIVAIHVSDKWPFAYIPRHRKLKYK